MKRRLAQILSLSVIATATARHSLVNSFVRCRRDAHSRHNRALTTSASGSLVGRRRRRQHQQNGGSDDNAMINNSNDFESTAKLRNRFCRFRSSPRYAPHIRRVVLLSDLHMDYTANRDWLSNLCGADEVDLDGVSSNASNAIISRRFGDNSIKNNISDKHTMMIVAGDVSHDLDILRWTFQTLKRKYGEVIYTPGNHELWIDRDDNKDEDGVQNTSIDKLERILQLCLEMNIRIGPMRVGGWDMDKTSSTIYDGNTDDVQPVLWVIPLLSWHHPSFDTEPPIECWAGIPSARKVVADYRRTRWPSPLSLMDDSIAHFFDSLNDIILDLDSIADVDANASTASNPTRILTFSHFIPRIELLPEKRYLSLPTLPRCVGSTFLESRLRQTGEKYCKNENKNSDFSDNDNGDSRTSDNVNRNNADNDICGNVDGDTSTQHHHHLHAFGHTHLSWDATIDGVRYVHVPLAYPREWEQRKRSLEIGSMKGDVGKDRVPVCLWEQKSICGLKEVHADASHLTGFPSKWLGGWWSKYYSVMPRKPDRNNELAPWVATRYRRLPGGEIETFDYAPKNGVIKGIKDR